MRRRPTVACCSQLLSTTNCTYSRSAVVGVYRCISLNRCRWPFTTNGPIITSYVQARSACHANGHVAAEAEWACEINYTVRNIDKSGTLLHVTW
jgi:hypothetical protein